MNKDELTILQNIRALVEQIPVSGYRNCAIITACCSDLDKLIARKKNEQ